MQFVGDHGVSPEGLQTLGVAVAHTCVECADDAKDDGEQACEEKEADHAGSLGAGRKDSQRWIERRMTMSPDQHVSSTSPERRKKENAPNRK